MKPPYHVPQNSKCIGATLGWSLRPEHVFRWEDGFVGVVYGYRQIHPELFDLDGWPLHPETKQRLEIHI